MCFLFLVRIKMAPRHTLQDRAQFLLWLPDAKTTMVNSNASFDYGREMAQLYQLWNRCVNGKKCFWKRCGQATRTQKVSDFDWTIFRSHLGLSEPKRMFNKLKKLFKKIHTFRFANFQMLWLSDVTQRTEFLLMISIFIRTKHRMHR